MKILCMIPVRLQSKRVPKKNIRFLGDKPLVEHIITTAKQVFDTKDIYLNAHEEVFHEIAERNKINYYKRPERYSYDNASNDDFVYDFLKKHECDWVIQAHSTSPFITKVDIQKFIKFIKEDNYDALYSVKEERIEAVYNGEPLNFKLSEQMLPSQQLQPLLVFCNGLMAWRRDTFIESYERKGYALFAGNIGYVTLSGYSVLDIDYEEDFQLAEGIYECLRNPKQPKYFDSNERWFYDVPRIMKDDGVASFTEELLQTADIDTIVNSMPKDSSWSKRIVNSPSNCVTLIYQMPNEGNRMHYHKDWDEVWLIYSGKWRVDCDDGKSLYVQKNDLVFIPRNTLHKITVIGNTPGMRIAISRDDVLHIYEKRNNSC